MYSWELETYIEERNHILTPEESVFVQNTNLHPQINHIKCEENAFHIWTDDGYHLWFQSTLQFENKKIKKYRK